MCYITQRGIIMNNCPKCKNEIDFLELKEWFK